jgi:hypothetical protein
VETSVVPRRNASIGTGTVPPRTHPKIDSDCWYRWGLNRCSRTAIQDPGLSLIVPFLLSMMGVVNYLTGRLAVESSATRHLPLALGYGSPLPKRLG